MYHHCFGTSNSPCRLLICDSLSLPAIAYWPSQEVAASSAVCVCKLSLLTNSLLLTGKEYSYCVIVTRTHLLISCLLVLENWTRNGQVTGIVGGQVNIIILLLSLDLISLSDPVPVLPAVWVPLPAVSVAVFISRGSGIFPHCGGVFIVFIVSLRATLAVFCFVSMSCKNS